MQKQMAVVSINKQDMQQASHLQAQLQKALQDQQALSSHLREEWQNQEQKLSIRYSCTLVPLVKAMWLVCKCILRWSEMTYSAVIHIACLVLFIVSQYKQCCGDCCIRYPLLCNGQGGQAGPEGASSTRNAG